MNNSFTDWSIGISRFINEAHLSLLAVGLILIGTFFLAREFWCWYFKLNHIKNLLEKIEENTRPVGMERKWVGLNQILTQKTTAIPKIDNKTVETKQDGKTDQIA